MPLERGKGLFVALEGVDGAGTTTQAQRLAQALRAVGVCVHVTAEPSSWPVGRLIREILSGRTGWADGRQLALLFAADRLEHWEREVQPKVSSGTWVISDRYLWSSLAYQSLEAPIEWVSQVNRFAGAPDLTILLDVPVEDALARIQGRSEHDLLERRDVQEKVRARYLELARSASGEQVLTMDGTRGIQVVTEAILERSAAACRSLGWLGPAGVLEKALAWARQGAAE